MQRLLQHVVNYAILLLLLLLLYEEIRPLNLHCIWIYFSIYLHLYFLLIRLLSQPLRITIKVYVTLFTFINEM